MGGKFIGDLNVDPNQIKNSERVITLSDEAQKVLVEAMAEVDPTDCPFASTAASMGLLVTEPAAGNFVSQWEFCGKTKAAEVTVSAADAFRASERPKVIRMGVTLPTIAKTFELDDREFAALESGQVPTAVRHFVRRAAYQCRLAIEDMFINGSDRVVGNNTIFGVSNLPFERRVCTRGANWAARETTGQTVENNVIDAMECLLREDVNGSVAIFCGRDAYSGLRGAYNQLCGCKTISHMIGEMPGIIGPPMWSSQMKATDVAFVEMTPESVDLHIAEPLSVMMYRETGCAARLCVYTIAVPRIKSWEERKSVVYQTV